MWSDDSQSRYEPVPPEPGFEAYDIWDSVQELLWHAEGMFVVFQTATSTGTRFRLKPALCDPCCCGAMFSSSQA